jgi:hypothetical protein
VCVNTQTQTKTTKKTQIGSGERNLSTNFSTSLSPNHFVVIFTSFSDFVTALPLQLRISAREPTVAAAASTYFMLSLVLIVFKKAKKVIYQRNPKDSLSFLLQFWIRKKSFHGPPKSLPTQHDLGHDSKMSG